MYRKLQQQVKEYIISSLSQLSSKWKFDIDTQNCDDPIIVRYSPNKLMVRARIETFHRHATQDMINNMMTIYKITNYNATERGGCTMIRYLARKVFDIYGIKITWHGYLDYSSYQIISKDNTKHLYSFIRGNNKLRGKDTSFVSPFFDYVLKEYLLNEQLVSPLLLLLDPIKYFRRYSIIIQKYPQLNAGNIVKIYEALLEYFPDFVTEIVEKFWLLHNIFWELSIDIANLVIDRLIDLL